MKIKEYIKFKIQQIRDLFLLKEPITDRLQDVVILDTLVIKNKTSLIGNIKLYADIIVEETGELLIYNAQIKALEGVNIISKGDIKILYSTFSAINSTWGNLTCIGPYSFISTCKFEHGTGIEISKISKDIKRNKDSVIDCSLFVKNNGIIENCTVKNSTEEKGSGIIAEDNVIVIACNDLNCD